MNSSAPSVVLLAILVAGALPASAQTLRASADEGGADGAPVHHIVRADLAFDLANRTFELDGPSEVLFDAPFYPGLRIGLEVFPVAIALERHPAAGLGLRVETTKHTLNTVAAYEVDGEVYDFDVPTRHDTSHFGLLYEWRAMDSLVLTPEIAWHTVEFGLGYNPLYRNSFYRGVEIGLGVDYELAVRGLSLGVDVDVRPGVDLGSTIEPYGSTASSFGFAVGGGLRYVSALGLYADASVHFDRYSTTYRPDRNENRDDSKSTDSFRGFVFAIGFAY